MLRVTKPLSTLLEVVVQATLPYHYRDPAKNVGATSMRQVNRTTAVSGFQIINVLHNPGGVGFSTTLSSSTTSLPVGTNEQ